MPLTEPDWRISLIRLFINTHFDGLVKHRMPYGYLRYKALQGFHSYFQLSDWTMPYFVFTY